MKTKLCICALLIVGFIFTVACTPENLAKNEIYTEEIDPNKECPPTDRNCNGIPDDEE